MDWLAAPTMNAQEEDDGFTGISMGEPSTAAIRVVNSEASGCWWRSLVQLQCPEFGGYNVSLVTGIGPDAQVRDAERTKVATFALASI